MMQKEVRQNNKMTLVAKSHEEITFLMQTPAVKTKSNRFTKIRILILSKVCVFNIDRYQTTDNKVYQIF